MEVSVLVVDDDPVFRGLVRRVLDGGRLVVIGEAETIAEAEHAASELRPDAVLVDVGLPDGNGISLARWLTAQPWSPRVVLTSTDPDAASAEDVRDAGAGAFVAKSDLPNSRIEDLLAGTSES